MPVGSCILFSSAFEEDCLAISPVNYDGIFNICMGKALWRDTYLIEEHCSYQMSLFSGSHE